MGKCLLGLGLVEIRPAFFFLTYSEFRKYFSPTKKKKRKLKMKEVCNFHPNYTSTLRVSFYFIFKKCISLRNMWNLHIFCASKSFFFFYCTKLKWVKVQLANCFVWEKKKSTYTTSLTIFIQVVLNARSPLLCTVHLLKNSEEIAQK